MSKLDVEIVEGNDPSVEFTCYDVDAVGNRTAANLTGALIECYVKANRSVADLESIKYDTVGGSIVITDAAGGKARVDMDSDDVGSVTVQWYHLDVIRNGRRITYAYGALKKVNV
jgi:hypothetical protein